MTQDLTWFNPQKASRNSGEHLVHQIRCRNMLTGPSASAKEHHSSRGWLQQARRRDKIGFSQICFTNLPVFFWGLNEAGLAAANSPMPLPGKESWRVCRKSRAAGCPRRGPRCLQCAWSSHLSPSPGHGLWGFQLVNPSRGGWRAPKMCQVASREHLLARRLREDLNKRLD